MNHTVDMCPVTKFEGRLQSLHYVEDMRSKLETTVITTKQSRHFNYMK